MKTIHTWQTIHFIEGKASVELTVNYSTGSFTMTHGSNDNNITFNGNLSDLKLLKDRLKCVNAAISFVKNNLTHQP